jgi:hypothetical protein
MVVGSSDRTPEISLIPIQVLILYPALVISPSPAAGAVMVKTEAQAQALLQAQV